MYNFLSPSQEHIFSVPEKQINQGYAECFDITL